MAKQSFVTGQVLTAAQLTSLQQTAMSGGAASAKTANYVLVAADAGTAISMTSTSATTITVNTGLFAAGDTVFIQNLGSATCTITAGTATVNTAGSLILPQYDAGILYFVSSSSAVFYDYIQVGATSPLTTKGDLYGFGTSDARIPIGTNNHVLTADSTQSLGLKWAAPAGAGANWTLLNSGGTAMTGADTITVSGISGANQILVLIDGAGVTAGANYSTRYRIYTDSGTNYYWTAIFFTPSLVDSGFYNQAGIVSCDFGTSTASRISSYLLINGGNSSGVKTFQTEGSSTSSGKANFAAGYWSGSATVSSVSFRNENSGNFTAGTMYVYTSAS